MISPGSVGVKSSSSASSRSPSSARMVRAPPLTPRAHSGTFESPPPSPDATSADAPEYPIACKRAKNITNSAQSPPQVVVVFTLDKSASASASTPKEDAPRSPPSISPSEPPIDADDDIAVNRETSVRVIDDVTARRRRRGKSKLPARTTTRTTTPLGSADAARDDTDDAHVRPDAAHRYPWFPLNASLRPIVVARAHRAVGVAVIIVIIVIIDAPPPPPPFRGSLVVT